jgi:hypothetical protein
MTISVDNGPFTNQTFRWQPWSKVAAEPFSERCKSETANEVRRVQDELRKRLDHVQAVHARRESAGKALTVAEDKVLTELDADALSMSDGSALEGVHAEALASLKEVDKLERLHDERLKRTTSLAQSAQDQLDAFVTGNWQELSAELEPAARKSSERVRKITAKYEQELSPLRQDWNAILEDQIQILGRTEGLYRSDLPALDDCAQPPVVSSEALARLNRVPEPHHQAPAVSIGAVAVSAEAFTILPGASLAIRSQACGRRPSSSSWRRSGPGYLARIRQ